MFKQAATYNKHTYIEEYTDTVTSYIRKCIDDVTHIKTIITMANKTPWLIGEVRRLLRAFRAGDETGLRRARADLSHGLRKAKQDDTNKITSHFRDSRDTLSLWRGIQTITDDKTKPQTCDSNISPLSTPARQQVQTTSLDCAEKLNVFTGVFNTSLISDTCCRPIVL